MAVARRRHRGADRSILGLLLIGLGLIWLLEETGLLALSAETVLAAMLMLVGLGLILTARRGRKHWPIILGGVLTLVLIANSSTLSLPNVSDVGQDTSQPHSLSDLQRDYRSGVGAMTLDLSQLAAADLKDQTVHVHHGVGSVFVDVPAGLSVHVQAHIGVGQLTLCGRQVNGGPGINDSHDYSAGPRSPALNLDVHQGIGPVTIRGCGTAPPTPPTTPTTPTAPATTTVTSA
jgi:hypothetical protein